MNKPRLAHFRGSRPAIFILVALIFIALFGDFMANERPIFVRFDSKNYWPAFRGIAVDLGLAHWPEPFLTENWLDLSFEKTILAPIPYSATTLDLKNSNCRSPLGPQMVVSKRWRHWLGTDSQGRDVAAGLIRGTRIAFLVGLGTMILAAFLGILIGSLAGFLGDERLKVSRIRLIINGLAFLAAIFFAFIARSVYLTGAFEILKSLVLVVFIFWLANAIARLAEKMPFPFLQKKATIPADMILMRFVEIFNATPRLILLIALSAAIEKPSIFLLIIIISFLSWTGVAKFIRAEMLRIREAGYVQAARMMGVSDRRIIWRHALPNALPPALTALAFGMGGAILAEAFLSFLGIGVPPSAVTWGSMLNEGRSHFEAPWLIIFPGLLLFLTILSFNLLGESIEKWLDPRRR